MYIFLYIQIIHIYIYLYILYIPNLKSDSNVYFWLRIVTIRLTLYLAQVK